MRKKRSELVWAVGKERIDEFLARGKIALDSLIDHEQPEPGFDCRMPRGEYEVTGVLKSGAGRGGTRLHL